MIGEPAAGTIQYEDFVGSASKEEIRIDLDPEDPFWQLYTSGTTGASKGVAVTHRSSLANAEHVIIDSRMNRDNGIWLLISPMFHVILDYMLWGAYVRAAIVIMEKFDLKELCKTIEKEKCTDLIMGPSMWQMFIDYPELDQYNLSS